MTDTKARGALFGGMGRKQRLALRAMAEADNKNWPEALAEVHPSLWPEPRPGHDRPVAVFRSRRYLVQIFTAQAGYLRLTVNRTEMDSSGRWLEGITWEELQELKAQAGFGDCWACELFPSRGAVVNVANMRHLWIMPGPPGFGWGLDK